MADTLSRICDAKRLHIADCKTRLPPRELAARLLDAPPPRDFAGALRRAAATGFGLIAEIKRASPSRGVIRANFDPPQLARAYAAGGATCLSVLTDTPYFQGADSDLVQARAACDLPVLRKDFMLDPYQIDEARLLGADCILLIVAALDTARACELSDAAGSRGMAVLLEVHDADEMARAVEIKSELIGINNRNLKTLTVDLDTTVKLAARAPAGRLLVTESGIRDRADRDRLAGTGARCFLVGESLIGQHDVTAATQAFLAGAGDPVSTRP
ncbi:MAG: indole-3-glycerol phosphate synthase TrpC [Azospirillaceae bacterium]|nr:indole-3-glycerol phosphate synthase TrpC [Azospirillaceae bacterium]